MKRKKIHVLIASLLFLFVNLPLSFSQNNDQKQDEIVEENPITAMLDSLVSLNFLNRHTIPTESPLDNQAAYQLKLYPSAVYRERFAKLQTPIPLNYNEQVRGFIELYAKRPQLTSKVLGLAQLYFPMFEKVLDQQNLPLELKYLAVVESALNPVAVSRAGATGIWQFMYNTGKHYGLKVTSYIDERRDPYKATYAACQYFKDMYDIYQDWLLVIAAYNCGPRNVNKAIARSGGKTNFWEIMRYLPRETRGYVPAFIAVNYIMNYASEHNISPTAPFISYFEVDSIAINQKLSFNQLSSLIDVPEEVISYLNPSFKRKIIPFPTEGKYILRLPSNKIALFIANSDKIFATSEETTDEYVTQEVRRYYKVRRGDNLSMIAVRLTCSLSELKRWNHLRSNMIHPGQTLVYYALETIPLEVKKLAVAADSAEVTADSSKIIEKNKKETMSSTSSIQRDEHKVPSSYANKYVYYIVQPGDTLWNIAQRYEGVTVEQLKSINRIINTKSLKPGTKIKVALSGS